MYSTHLKFLVYNFLLILAMSQTATGQRYGLPGTRNFSRSEYNGGTQNWSMGQAENGMMYFANNDGLLEFDGAHWKIYRDLKLILRSLCIDGDRIYVGAYNRFGYYGRDEKGALKYHSLLPLLKGRMNDFDEIWRIHKTANGIVFQSFKAIFIYNGDQIEIVKPRSKFHFSYYVNGVLWVYDERDGLMQLREGKVRQIPGGGFFSGTEIWTILPVNEDKVIIGTAKKGVFRYDGQRITPWNNPANEMLRRYQIFSGAMVGGKCFAFGTIQNGLIVTDTSGQVLLNLNKERGILNNTVLSVASDIQGDIWLGLDNGISLVRFNSPITYVQDYFDLGSGYASARFGDNLYLGTNQGLFYIPWTVFKNPLKRKEDFRLIEGTEGQVWSLQVIDNALFCGHNFGVFRIEGDKAEKISTVPGAWNFRKCGGKVPLILVGNYSGISVLSRKGKDWTYRNELAGFDQSSHYFELDDHGNIWVSHGYKGIFRLETDSLMYQVKRMVFYDTTAGLPDVIGNIVFRLQAGIIVATRDGICRFDEAKGRFIPDSQFTQLLPGYTSMDYITKDSRNNIWYYNDHQPGVLRLQEDGSLKNITVPFTELKGRLIPAYGHIDVLEDNNVLIGIEGGFAHYVSGQYRNYAHLPALYISELKSRNPAEGVFRYNSKDEIQTVVPRFRFRNNTVTIGFAASQYPDDGTTFQFRLEGFDADWSGWLTQHSKEYTNLPAGTYTFLLRARTDSGRITPVLKYRFEILSPWYRSTLAWIIYILMLVALAGLAYRFFMRSMEKSRLKEQQEQKDKYRQREQQLKEEALLTEKEMIRLRNEKLNMEMIHKEKELANSTYLIIQKNEILNKLKTDLNKIRNAVSDEHLKNEINITMKRIGKELDNEKQWQLFNTHVEQVHEDLFKKLTVQHPCLTPRELSLCAYLRMNISSKEIASLMNISTRGVEISRYRIRKKLGLDRNANLTDFMIKL